MVQKVDLKWLAAENVSFVLFFSYEKTTIPGIIVETQVVFTANAY